jgi:NADPH2:quinone reductase
MAIDHTRTALQLRSLVKASGELELSLASIEIPKPGPNEVLVRVDAAPINPSDLGLLFGPADPSTAKVSGTADRPIVTAEVHEKALKAMAGRVDVSMPVGNEGAGLVVETGTTDAARALDGKMVAALGGGGMYGQYRCVPAEMCLVLPEGATAAEGASSFVNPLTALGMLETLKREGHKAIVHTAAASSLGQMLLRLCEADGIPLVNVVRKDEQAALLKDMGAKYVCNTSSPTFLADLTEAMAATGATLAFDATGGGKLPNQLLTCMEAAISRTAKGYSRYGSNTHKQVYIYGGLEAGPTELSRGYGMAWGVGGWLVFPFLQKVGADVTARLKKRVAAELKTTFATQYAKEISLTEMLSLDAIAEYAKRTTGGKYLITPQKGLS